jgi:hypothetical protein
MSSPPPPLQSPPRFFSPLGSFFLALATNTTRSMRELARSFIPGAV